MMKIYNTLGRLAVYLLLLASVPLYAQSVRVSGTIVDDTGQAVPGVSILEKGTSNGTTTDTDGKYTINVGSGSSTLVFSFIGYKSQELGVNNQSTINVSL